MAERLVTWLLVAIFLASGLAKLFALDFETEAFARWGYPSWFMYATGALEVAGAVGLLVRRLARLAAFGLTLLMFGAIGTHLLHAEWAMAVVAGSIAALAAWRGGKGAAGQLEGRQ